MGCPSKLYLWLSKFYSRMQNEKCCATQFFELNNLYWYFSSTHSKRRWFFVYKKLATFKANFVFYAVGRFSRHQFWNEHMITWTQRFALGSQKHPSLYKVSERLLFSHILAPYGATNNLLRKMSNGHAIMEY